MAPGHGSQSEAEGAMLSAGLEVALWLFGGLAVLIAYGIATDPTHRKSAKTKRLELAESWLDRLDQGGPRD